MNTGFIRWLCTFCLAWCPLAFATEAPNQVSLVFAGDIVFDDAAGEMIRRGEDPFADLAAVFGEPTSALETLSASLPPAARQVTRTTPFAHIHAQSPF